MLEIHCVCMCAFNMARIASRQQTLSEDTLASKCMELIDNDDVALSNITENKKFTLK